MNARHDGTDWRAVRNRLGNGLRCQSRGRVSTHPGAVRAIRSTSQTPCRSSSLGGEGKARLDPPTSTGERRRYWERSIAFRSARRGADERGRNQRSRLRSAREPGWARCLCSAGPASAASFRASVSGVVRASCGIFAARDDLLRRDRRDKQQWQEEEVAAADREDEQGGRDADREGSHGRFLELRRL